MEKWEEIVLPLFQSEDLTEVKKVLQIPRLYGLFVIYLYFKKMHIGSWCASQVLAVFNFHHLWSRWPWFLPFPNKMYGSFTEISLGKMCDRKVVQHFCWMIIYLETAESWGKLNPQVLSSCARSENPRLNFCFQCLDFTIAGTLKWTAACFVSESNYCTYKLICD